jgi:Gpi18-like mannosyltransferase
VPAALASDQAALAAQRTAMIDKLFGQITKDPSNVYQYVSSQMSNDVYPRIVSGENIADLAPIYTANQDKFAKAKLGDTINL